MADVGDTAGFAALTPASEEDIRALEAYFCASSPADKPATSKSDKGASIQLFVGIPLLAGAAIWCFTSGRTFMGIFLLPFLAFAIFLAVLTLKDGKGTEDRIDAKPASPVEALRASNELDAAARDFPREAQEPGDHIRFGNSFVFDRDQHTVRSYAQIQRLQVKELAKGGETVALTLEAQLRGGGTQALFVGGATAQDRARVNDICQRIQRGNPYVQLG